VQAQHRSAACCQPTARHGGRLRQFLTGWARRTTPVAVAFTGNTGDQFVESQMKITDFVPQSLVPFLTHLGKYQWIKAQPLPGIGTRFFRQIPDDLPEEFDDELMLVEAVDYLTLTTLFAASRALASGQKLLRPTYEQCAALEQVELTIRFDDYQQPYPALFVEVPERYQRELTQRYGVPCPHAVLCHHDKSSGCIFCITDAHDGTFPIVDILPPSPNYSMIEQALNAPADEGADIEQSRVLQRVAMNLCILLTFTGVRQLGPADPQRIANLRKVVRGSKRRLFEVERRLKEGMPTLITFEQKIDFYTRKSGDDAQALDDTSSTGRKNKPHRRKGFYKMQPFGPGRSQRKLIFIAPVLVNRHLFSGHVEDTRTIYSGKGSG
jgi:hypothetical protein